ncbi:hypothetical protein Caci_8588 [Catenulispora acidiphila DSM 44928]|uniref:Uncharacterized protein n=1 Tax=Catenulispora acidiphila (strain DSM 44928 / JCM 14897 / NBRC 102108 / NRRL B-24433 / ID139908) TaxID=479433 RepID=C7PYT5_CATAD|nr:hypothetical protein [Catenulispora acidiphila]ACU77407.1 hypothetical protein Caci_8588 [Catenulispora acidiphila DSM 44928]
MRGPEEIRAFLSQHNDGRVVGQVPAMFGVTVTEAEAEFQRRLLSAGHTSSYLALLGLAATLTFDAGEYFPSSEQARRDLSEWHGYHRGLQTALACLVMYETGSNPQQAALQVAEHTETLIRCRWTNRPTPGGG